MFSLCRWKCVYGAAINKQLKNNFRTAETHSSKVIGSVLSHSMFFTHSEILIDTNRVSPQKFGTN